MNTLIKDFALDAIVKNIAVDAWVFTDEELDAFAKLIINECIAKCDEIADDASVITNSKFASDASRVLYDGKWVGAKNCAAKIKQTFEVE